MKFKNLDINILYILDKHHHYTSGDGFSEPDRFHRAFSDIPGENVSAVMKALHKDGLIYYHEDGEKISITRKGTAKVESFRKCQLGYCHCTSAVLFYLTRSYWQITLMLPQFWRRHNQAGQPGIYPRLIQNPNDTDDVIEIVVKRSIDAGDLSEGDLAIITAGQPVWVADMTNMIRVKRMPLPT